LGLSLKFLILCGGLLNTLMLIVWIPFRYSDTFYGGWWKLDIFLVYIFDREQNLDFSFVGNHK